MKRTITILAVVIALIAAAVGIGWLYFKANPAAWDEFVAEMQGETSSSSPRPVKRQTSKTDGLMASGSIEAEEITVATEIGGRVVELTAGEGDEVIAGEMLLRLDTETLLAQREGAEAAVAQAQAAVDAAQAQLALAKAGARPEELAAVESSLAAAEAGLDAAQAGYAAAEGQLDAAQAQLAAAEGQLLAAEATQKLAESELDSAKAGQVMVEQAQAGVDVAEANLDAAQAAVDAAAAMVAVAQAGVDGAQAGVDAAQAQFDQAQAALDLLQAGARDEEIEILEAGVTQAKAAMAGAESAVKALDLQLERTALLAPTSGVVLQRLVHVGELAAPGAPLFTLADLDEVTLTVYVPEANLGQVSLGQTVKVTVDAYEDVFTGRVSHIASQAEFTPKNVQTQEERVHIVFAVKIRLENADHKLKPGMPADAVFRE